MSPVDDKHFMQHALRMAARGLGRAWPNPSVGAVIVKHGAVVGRGCTASGGRPHAETIALAQAGDHAKGATLYVTLEPCGHQGQTPPCAQAIIKAGITRVVAACIDPNPQVSGGGLAQLRAAGIEVENGTCETEARALNEGFFSVIERGRPFVTLKLATSLDGKITGAARKSQWITGEAARKKVHLLRGSQDAILTGIGTVLADDPQLTCRLPGRDGDSPQRVVLDTQLRIPAQAKILPAWIFTSERALAQQPDKKAALEKAGAMIFSVPLRDGKLVLDAVLGALAQRGVTRLMVEAGSALASAFVAQQLVDRLWWFRAPLIIGESGLSALTGYGKGYTLRQTERCGEDILDIYDCGASRK